MVEKVKVLWTVREGGLEEALGHRVRLGASRALKEGQKPPQGEELEWCREQ